MEDLGKVFREFRMSKNYSLKEAAGEACSTSQLSRFEWIRPEISNTMSMWP